MDNIIEKQIQMKAIDWNITGSITREKYDLNILYADGKRKRITDTLTNLTKIIKTL